MIDINNLIEGVETLQDVVLDFRRIGITLKPSKDSKYREAYISIIDSNEVDKALKLLKKLGFRYSKTHVLPGGSVDSYFLNSLEVLIHEDRYSNRNVLMLQPFKQMTEEFSVTDVLQNISNILKVSFSKDTKVKDVYKTVIAKTKLSKVKSLVKELGFDFAGDGSVYPNGRKVLSYEVFHNSETKNSVVLKRISDGKQVVIFVVVNDSNATRSFMIGDNSSNYAFYENCLNESNETKEVKFTYRDKQMKIVKITQVLDTGKKRVTYEVTDFDDYTLYDAPNLASAKAFVKSYD